MKRKKDIAFLYIILGEDYASDVDFAPSDSDGGYRKDEDSDFVVSAEDSGSDWEQSSKSAKKKVRLYINTQPHTNSPKTASGQ